MTAGFRVMKGADRTDGENLFAWDVKVTRERKEDERDKMLEGFKEILLSCLDK